MNVVVVAFFIFSLAFSLSLFPKAMDGQFTLPVFGTKAEGGLGRVCCVWIKAVPRLYNPAKDWRAE